MRVIDDGAERDATPLERFAIAMVTIGACGLYVYEWHEQREQRGGGAFGMTFEEIGKEIGRTEERARQVFHRAVAKLRRGLDAETLSGGAVEIDKRYAPSTFVSAVMALRPGEQRQGRGRPKQYSESALLDVIARNPGCSSYELTRLCLLDERSRATIHHLCRVLEKRGLARCESIMRPGGVVRTPKPVFVWYPLAEAAE